MQNKSKLIYKRIRQSRFLRKRRRALNKSRLNRIKRSLRKRRRAQLKLNSHVYLLPKKEILTVPKYFDLLVHTESVLSFINKIEALYAKGKQPNSVQFELKNIISIDIGAICLFLSKLNELSRRGIRIWGTFPNDSYCSQFIKDSGFLDRMKDMNSGNDYPKTNNNLILNRGFDTTQNTVISEEIKKAVQHITGIEKAYKPIYSMGIEICANSIEHANEVKNKKNWVFSTRYLDGEVVFIMIDIGDGILKTLKRKYFRKIKDQLLNTSCDVLKNAFEKQYESRTEDSNRNKGLPKINEIALNHYVNDLTVITNDVFLGLSNPEISKLLKNKFKGTFYYWTLNKECIERWESRLKK